MYPSLNSTAVGQDLTEYFCYANALTSGMFILFVIIAFFLVVLISSLMMQLRFSSRLRLETSMLASSFVTLGFSVIFMQKACLLNPIYLIILFIMTILSLIWVMFSE